MSWRNDPLAAPAAPAGSPATPWANDPIAGPTARQTLTTAVTMKPDSVAEAARLAKRYPAPPEVIMQDLEAYRLQEVLDLADTDLQKAPMLREIMRRDVKVAAMAQDDIPTLKKIESNFAKTSAASAAQAVLGISEGIWRTPDAAQRAVGYLAETVEKTGLPRYLNPIRGVQDVLRFVGEGRIPGVTEGRGGTTTIAGQIRASQKLLGEDTSTFGTAFADVQTMARNADQALATAVKTGELQQVGQIITDPQYWAAFMSQAIPSLYLAIKSGGSAAFMGWLEGMEQASNAAEFEAKTGQRIGDAEFTQAVTQTALVNALLERYGLDKVLGAKGNGLKGIAKAIVGEGGTEALQQINTNLAALLAYNPEQGLLEGVLSSAMGGVASGGGVSSAQVAAQQVQAMMDRRMQEQTAADQYGQLLKDQLTTAGQSLLRERSPEQFRAALAEMSDGKVYVDGEVLNQLPPDVLNQLPESVRAQIPDAVAGNSPVEIAVADALTIAPGTPLEQVLLEHGRSDPFALSQSESKAAGERAANLLQQEAQRVIAQAADQEALRQSQELVKTNIKQQLAATGRFRDAVNEGYATWAAAFYTAYGSRLGMTPEQFYQRYPLRVLGAPVGQQTGVLNAGEQKPGQLDGIEAYHWSMAARPTLSSAFYGTGLKGSARDEIMSYPDQRVRQRLSFYVDKGTGVRPEAGVGWVAHRATLNNIYDANLDPLKLRGGNAREFETRVLDAGFDGYLYRLEGDQPGQVIMLGDRTVQPEVLGPLSRVKPGQQVPALARREAPWQTQASGTPEQLQARLERMQSSPAWGDYDLRIEGSELQVRKKGGVFEQSVSTRLPTAKKATENPLEEMLIIGLDAAKMDRQAFEANMAVVRGYPNMRPAGRASADTLAERFIQHVVDNLLWLHDQVPADIRSRSKLWYDGARAIVDRWAPKYGLTDAQVSAVLAVLSPQKDWFMNVSLAERVLDAMTNGRDFRWDQAMTDKVNEVLIKSEEEQKALAAEEGADYEPVDPSRYYEAVKRIQGKTLGEVLESGDDRDAAIWIRVYDQAFNTRNYRIVSPGGDFLDWKRNNPSKAQKKKRGEPGDMGRVAWGSFGDIGKAVSVARDGSIANISNKLGGQHKVRNFYNNIFNPQSEHGDVTIDTHAVAAALLRPLAGGSDEVKHNFGSGGVSSSSVFGAKGTYGIYAEAYRRAAAERKILPREMQSITWEAVRGLFQAEQKKALQQTVNAVWRGYRKGEVTLDEARAETLRLANGIVNPDWVGTARGAGPAWASSYSEELAGAELPVRGGADGRGAVGDARGTAGDAGGVDGQGRLEQAGNGAGRYSSGSLAPLEGAPNVAGAAGPDPRLVAVAEQYARDNGIPLRRQAAYAKVDPERAARIAAAYEAMPHAPQDPAVREAYDDLARQTMAQYQALVDAGYQFWFMDPAADPYQGNPWNAMRDLRANQSMAVFPTESGFGTGEFDPEGNPLLADTGLEWAYGSPDGQTKRVLFNDLFRAVHDAFGHGLEGAGFRAQGEENAWQAHVRLFTGPAVGAITSETRGQNSWLNYGPNGAANQTAKVEDTVFADQKTGLMPEWTWSEGRVADEQQVALEQGARGTFNPQTLELVLNPNADLSTWFHETGHFFLEVLADVASQPGAPAQITDDYNKVLAWFGVTPEQWAGYSLDEKRPYHERWAESIEQYVMEGKAPSVELQSVMRRFSAWLKSVYKSITQFVAGKPELELNDDIRRVMDRMLATDEQIQQANEVAGFMPDEQADGEAAERLQKRSMADLKWAVRARDAVIAKLKKQAREVEKATREQVTVEVDQMPEMRAKAALDALAVTPEYAGLLAEHKAQRQAAETQARQEITDAAVAAEEAKGGELKGLKKGQFLAKMKREIGNQVEARMIEWDRANPRPARPVNATDQDVATIADSFGFESVDAMLQAIDAFGKRADAIDGLTEQRMLEENGDLIDERAIQEAANEAVHNEARARSLATELRTQGEMLGQRTDTGEVNAKGSKITVNALVEAAKQFGANVIARTPLKDLKATAWKHTAAERRAGKRWAEATAKGETQEAVRAKQDQVLNNAAAKAAIDAATEAKKILEFFKRVTKGNDEKTVEKGRDPDIVNAARAVLAAYGIQTPASKGAVAYLEAVKANDPETYAAIEPMIAAATQNAQPLEALTFEELQGLHESIQAMWFLAKRSRQMEVAGDLLDIDDVAQDIYTRLEEIGIPDRVPGEGMAVTKGEERTLFLQQGIAFLRRVEQWAEGMDGKYGGPFLRFIFQPIKDAADRYRAERIDYRKKFQALVDNLAPIVGDSVIQAPELGYTFGTPGSTAGTAMNEILHAVLHTGNDSNKRKLLLGRGWATENPDGTLDTSRWDAFLGRLVNEGKLERAHFDFVQGMWDLLEQTKPLAQKAHRDAFGRYFSEVTANAFVDPFGVTRRGGYVPAQVDSRLVKDNVLRTLAEDENNSMAYAFPQPAKGFTMARTEYNRPLMLDLRTLSQHLDKVLLFSHMTNPARDARKLLKRKTVSQPLDRIQPAAIESMLQPWLTRSAQQIVETPIVGAGKWGRIPGIVRSRAGMALMFANVSNAIQQITGLAGAAVRVKPSYLMRSLAQYVASPVKFSRAVWDASPYMDYRAKNEVAVMNEQMQAILIKPSTFQKAQDFSMRHAYFLQTALDNVLSPIVWTGALNQALADGMSEQDAIRFADSTVRQTQGSTLPEDVSRFETGPAYARAFTQFVGYFNMMANTNGTALKQIADEVGLKKGAGKALYVVMMGLMAPIWVAEAIALAFKGGPEDEDDDGYLDDWLAAVFGMGTTKGLLAQIPILGQFGVAAANRFNDNPLDDRVSLSPAISLLESSVSAPESVYKAIVEDGSAQKAIRDVATLVSVATGVPVYGLARPIGYAAGVAQGKIEPTSAADAARGLVTGTASPESKVR